MTGQTDSLLTTSGNLTATLHLSQSHNAKFEILVAQKPGNRPLGFHSLRLQPIQGVDQSSKLKIDQFMTVLVLKLQMESLHSRLNSVSVIRSDSVIHWAVLDETHSIMH